jgi:hypothetical protein
VAFKVGHLLLIVNFGGQCCSSFLFLFPTQPLSIYDRNSNPEKEKQKRKKKKEKKRERMKIQETTD